MTSQGHQPGRFQRAIQRSPGNCREPLLSSLPASRVRSFLVLVLCTLCVCPLSGSATAASSDRTFLIGEMYRYTHSSIMCANMGFAIDCVIDGLLLQESAKGMENITVRADAPVVDLPTAPGSPVVSLRAEDIEMLP